MTRDTPRRPVPLLSLVFGYGPVAPLPLLALAAWTAPLPWNILALAAGQILGGVLLIFLAGVRRGLSFFTAGGPRRAQMLTMLWLFAAGGLGLTLPPLPAMLILAIGFASVALLDPPAAARGEVPDHFATLRPPQMAVAIAGLAGLLARMLIV